MSTSPTEASSKRNASPAPSSPAVSTAPPATIPRARAASSISRTRNPRPPGTQLKGESAMSTSPTEASSKRNASSAPSSPAVSTAPPATIPRPRGASSISRTRPPAAASHSTERRVSDEHKPNRGQFEEERVVRAVITGGLNGAPGDDSPPPWGFVDQPHAAPRGRQPFNRKESQR